MRNIWPLKGNISTASKGSVFVGISGGVDSAVCAALLQQQGYDVTGVFIKIQIPGYPCPAAQDRVEAMRVAAHLRIPFIEIDLSKEYEQEVFAPSIEEFKKGNTPNPDTLCNEKIKFGLFYDFARSRGAQFVATGHYARLIQTSQGETLQNFARFHLAKAVDASKDQSYFLWAVPQEALQHVLFPVGGLQKTQVRALAKKFGLPNAVRKDSQGLCFLGDIGIEDMLMREVPHAVGEVLSQEGEVLGSHKGAALYTLGQRHGFELAVHTPAGEPHFVIAKDLARNTITVSSSPFPRNARTTRLVLSNTNWLGEVPDGAYEAQYRYHGKLIPAQLQRTLIGTGSQGRSFAILGEPHYAPLGQSLVLYKGERCIGGGIIESATLTA